MSGVALVLHQFRYDQKSFWRNPAQTLSRKSHRI